MATKILEDLCIACDACLEGCPMNAITDGTDVGLDNSYYIHPDKCNECVGWYNFAHCQSECPVEGCIIPDPDRIEEEGVLIKRALTMYPSDAEFKARIESGSFPSLKRNK
jgi:ferredoxin